jgi:hypothetical protein
MFPHERSLVERLKNEPFALIGVNSDEDREKLKPVLDEEHITWRSFWNGPQGPSGPLSAAWNVHGWPTLYVLDAQGVIRAKDVRDEHALDTLLDGLVAEAKSAGAK